MAEINSKPLVLTSREGTVQIVTLNRPEKSNALHPDLVNQLAEILEAAARNQQVNVIVLTGAGRSFSAGLDLELLLKWTTEEKLAYLDTVLPVFRRVWEMPQPIIAAVNGPAIAGGFDLAAFCDLRLASTEAIFGQAEINLGLT